MLKDTIIFLWESVYCIDSGICQLYAYQYNQSMKLNKKGKANTKQKAPIKSLQLYETLGVVHTIVSMVLQRVKTNVGVIEQAKERRKKQLEYAKVECQAYFYSYLNQMLADEPIRSVIRSDELPTNIQMDTLAVATLEKSTIKNTATLSQKSKSIRQATIESLLLPSTHSVKQASVQLPLETIEEVTYVTELRQKKIDEEMSLKKEAALAALEREKSLKKKSNSQISINFDYNGKILQRKNIEYGNLVHKVLENKLKQQKIMKKTQLPPEPSSVTPNEKVRYLKRSKSKQAQEEFTEFLDCQSLTDSIDINRGIRYSHNSLVFEEKIQKISAKQLKSRLGQRRMSKVELSRLKEFDEKKQIQRLKKMKTEQFQESNLSHKRSLSEANFNSYTLKKRGIINVMNPELRSSMLIRLSEYQPYLVIQKEFPEDERLLYDQRPTESINNLSEISKNQNETRSRITQSVRMTPKLPPIKRQRQSNQDDLIITKLQQELQNKLRI